MNKKIELSKTCAVQSDKFIFQKFIKSEWSQNIHKPWIHQSWSHNFITENSKICIMGCCFARNLGRWFREKGTQVYDIPWGIHFHTKAILKEIKNAVGCDKTPDYHWELLDGRENVIFIDPFRHPVEATTLYDLNIQKNNITNLSKKVIVDADVFIFSLCIAEVWEEKIKDVWYSLGRGPTEENFNSQKFRHRILSMSECKADIAQIVTLIRRLNKKSKIIFLVSPIPLKHSLSERHIYVANNKSKTALLGAIYEYIDLMPDDVMYFPAYEIFMSHPKNKFFWQADKRHITAEGIELIGMEIVKAFYKNKNIVMKKDKHPFFVKIVDENGRVISDK